MTPRRRLAKPLALLVAGATLAGCGGGSLEGASLEAKIEKDLEGKLKDSADVRCPKEIKLQAMSTLDCPATVGDTKGVVQITQQDDKGNVRYQYRQRSR
ncbi:MAG TPA: DUF4333 domain-containing protein [Thermoleophilaceae bacterium]|nr:DUF4333 domain-containing protein [Thermoleophilaceae bacterium]